MTTVNDAVREMMATMERIYEVAHWKTCPICGEDWTKLAQMYFYRKDTFDKWRRCECWVCAPCSRSVSSIPWLVERFQVDPFDGDVLLLDAFRNIIFSKEHDKSFAFYLNLPNAKIVPCGLGVEVVQEGKPKEFFPNVAAAMMFLTYGKKETAEATEWL